MELQKPNVEGEVYNNNKKCEYTHLRTHPLANQNSPTNIKYDRLTWQIKETENYIYQVRTKLTEAQTGKQTKARCQLGNKAMKIKLTDLLRGKERKRKE